MENITLVEEEMLNEETTLLDWLVTLDEMLLLLDDSLLTLLLRDVVPLNALLMSVGLESLDKLVVIGEEIISDNVELVDEVEPRRIDELDDDFTLSGDTMLDEVG